MRRNKLLSYIGGHSLEPNPMNWKRDLLELENGLKGAAKSDSANIARFADTLVEAIRSRLQTEGDPVHRADLKKSLGRVNRILKRAKQSTGRV